MNQIIHVSCNNGDYATISSALGSISANNAVPITIAIAPGVYHEKVTIDKPFVTLLGTGARNTDTIIEYDDYAYFIMEDGKKRGTFRSYTMFLDAHDITLKNLTIANSSGDSATHGQAIALYADGDRLTIDSCRLLGHQDTLFTGPLPPKEYEPDGFIGPKQFARRINGRQYYKNCYICGDIDFIFGSATAYFESCTIESLRRSNPQAVSDTTQIEGYVTAASTPNGQEYGYVFSKCRFLSNDCPTASVYLGRPWRDYAKTVLLNCKLGAHLHPAGFHDWNKEQARGTVLFAEYHSMPLDTEDSCASFDCAAGCNPFSRRADFVCELTSTEAEHFSKEQVLSGTDGWGLRLVH